MNTSNKAWGIGFILFGIFSIAYHLGYHSGQGSIVNIFSDSWLSMVLAAIPVMIGFHLIKHSKS